MPLLDEWLALEGLGRSLDQEALNLHLLRTGASWQHAVSPLVTDAFVVSADGQIAVLSDRAITRDPQVEGFGGIHNKMVLEKHLKASAMNGHRLSNET